jgi:ubiquinone/menaquinone biosynthesis C-methylase UbiE
MSGIKQESIKQWTADPCGAVYAKKYPEGSKEFFDHAIDYRYHYAPWLADMLVDISLSKGSALDVGCGMGFGAYYLALGGMKVTGIDITPKQIELATKMFEAYGIPGDFIVGDAESLPFPDKSFDIVISLGVLHHTPGIQQAINEIQRVLKPSGSAFILLYHKNSWHYWVNLMLIHGILFGKLRHMTKSELLSSSVEYSSIEARPLVNVYTVKDCKQLFRTFSHVSVSKHHWASEQIYLPYGLSKYLPKFLPNILGWYTMTKAVK